MIENDNCIKAVKTAIELGYRHIDTAQDYYNEAEVAAGIKASGAAREDVFITTKVKAAHKTYASAEESINQSLALLDTDYIDLVIIHSPQPWDKFGVDNRFKEGNLDAWRALEDAHKAGKIRAIGVSNFEKVDLENIIQNGSIKPAVSQVLAHISNMPFDLIEFCNDNEILVEAYSPVGHGELLKNQTLATMANQYDVSIPQLCIRYLLQLGLLPLPKSATPSHIQNNAELNFIISGDDMLKLNKIEKIKDYGEASVFPVYGGKL